MSKSIYSVAYAAGLFDGEGNISIHRRKRGNRLEYSLEVTITNTNLPLLEFIKAEFGGKYYPLTARPNRKPCWQWKVFYKNADEFIDLLYPFSIVKKHDMDVARKFRQSMSSSSRKLPQEVMDLREACYKEMKKGKGRKIENVSGQEPPTL